MNPGHSPTAETLNRLWFRAISEHVYAKSGILLHGENRSVYERRVREVAERHHIRQLSDYYMRLKYHIHAERLTQELIEHITTGETYFYRESRQLNFVIDRLILPRLQKQPHGQPLQIWSAGCSTGEEPYTLAIMLQERSVAANQVSILGGDINNRVLNIAREGVYRENSFRVLPAELKSSYFEKTHDGKYRITDKIRAMVEFAWLNLIDAEALSLLPAPDVLFCRNVLIYFDRQSKRQAIDNVFKCLRPDGLMFLGHAESLFSLEHRFVHEQTDGEVYYRKTTT